MKPALVVSFDFELGWGVLDDPVWKDLEAKGLYTRLRSVLADLFGFLESRQIPTTWATVSSMLVDDRAELELDHLPEPYRSSAAAFFDEAAWPTRCANDLMESWHRSLDGFSEIASHTATHLYASAGAVTGSAYRRDVEISLERLDAVSPRPVESLVFTRDETDFLSQVLELRPLNVRVPPTGGGGYGGSSTAGRLVRGAARFLRSVPASEFELVAGGGSAQSGSLYFNWTGSRFSPIKSFQVRALASRMLDQLTKGTAGLHVWLHPFNLAETTEHLPRFKRFMARAADLRDAGQIDILTMREFATRGRRYVE